MGTGLGRHCKSPHFLFIYLFLNYATLHVNGPTHRFGKLIESKLGLPWPIPGYGSDSCWAGRAGLLNRQARSAVQARPGLVYPEAKSITLSFAICITRLYSPFVFLVMINTLTVLSFVTSTIQPFIVYAPDHCRSSHHLCRRPHLRRQTHLHLELVC